MKYKKIKVRLSTRVARHEIQEGYLFDKGFAKFVIHRNPSSRSNWAITEYKTGFAVRHHCKTRKEAIELLDLMIIEKGEQCFIDAINDTIKNYGVKNET
jgi:hypothetical protein